MTQNEKAFLYMIAWSELGPEILAQSDNGYNVLAGSLPGMVLTFSSYHRHPGVLLDMDGKVAVYNRLPPVDINCSHATGGRTASCLDSRISPRRHRIA